MPAKVRGHTLIRLCHLCVGLFVAIPCAVLAQVEERLIDQIPFDELVIKGDAHAFKLVPFEMAKRTPLVRGAAEDELIIRLLDRPEQKYSVKWNDIERVTLFEELVLTVATQQVVSGRFADAYEGFQCVQRRAPGFPGLEVARQACLLTEARNRMAAGQPEGALVPLRELCHQNRDYPELSATMGAVVDQLVEHYFAAGQEAAARELIEQLADDYPDHAVVLARRQQLMARARDHLAVVVEAMRTERWHDAHDAMEQTLSVWPTLAEAQPVAAELNARYPLVRVGVRDRTVHESIVPGAASWEIQRLRKLMTLDVTVKWQPPAWPTGLSWPALTDPTATDGTRQVGAYTSVMAASDVERRFVTEQKEVAGPGPPREISERFYENVVDAIRDFDARRLAVLDRLAPWELDLIRTRPDLVLVPYAVPTVHLLVPNPRSSRMVSGSARRAISLGIARERVIVEDLSCGAPPVVVALSGVFPVGTGAVEELEPPRYDPRLAIALSRATQPESRDELSHLVLICDRSLLARRAAQAIQQQLKWDGLGYDVELVEPSVANSPTAASDWDLALVEWPGMDPPRDIWILAAFLAETGALNGECGEALQQLGQAREATDVDRSLSRIQRCLVEQSLVIPLWQVTEHAAVHKSLRGVGDRSACLYDQIEKWTWSEMP